MHSLPKPHPLRSFLLVLAYSNSIIALNACGYAYTAVVLGGLPVEPAGILLPGLSTFVVYSLDKVLRCDTLAESLNDPERSAFLARWRILLIGLTVLAMVAGLAVALPFGWKVTFAYLLPLVAGLLYSVPWLPAGFRYRRLKEVTGGKSLTVAISWSLATVLTPLYCAGASWNFGLKVAMLWVFARLIVNTVYFDMADLAGDRAEGLVTIPVALGHTATRRWLHGLNLLAGMALLIMTVLGYLPPAAYALILMTPYAAFYLRRATNENAPVGFMCDVVADGEGIVAALLAWLASCL